MAFEVRRTNADLQVAWLSAVLSPFLALDLQDTIMDVIKVDLRKKKKTTMLSNLLFFTDYKFCWQGSGMNVIHVDICMRHDLA